MNEFYVFFLQKFEFFDGTDSQAERIDSTDILLEKIREAQQMNWFKHYITRFINNWWKSILIFAFPEVQLKKHPFEFMQRMAMNAMNWSLWMLLKSKHFANMVFSLCPLAGEKQFLWNFNKFYIFRESDWLFATPKGRTILRKNCELHRFLFSWTAEQLFLQNCCCSSFTQSTICFHWSNPKRIKSDYYGFHAENLCRPTGIFTLF